MRRSAVSAGALAFIFCLVTVYAGHMPLVSDQSELKMYTYYGITVDRRTIEVQS